MENYFLNNNKRQLNNRDYCSEVNPIAVVIFITEVMGNICNYWL